MRLRTGEHAGEGGFTLTEVVIAVALLGLIMATLAVSFDTVFRTHEETSQRHVESLDAQTASAFLANDVQSMMAIGGNCGTQGTRLVSFDLGSGDVVTYRHMAAEGLLVREACGSTTGSTAVARWLDTSAPVEVTCRAGGCADGSRPHVVEIAVTARNLTVNGVPKAIDGEAFSYTLTGARRTTGLTDPVTPDVEVPPFVALTTPAGVGAGVLKFTGSSTLKVYGSLVVDSDQAGAVQINSNSRIVADRFFIKRNGTCVACTAQNSSPLPVAYDEPITDPNAGLDAPPDALLPIDPVPVAGFFLPGRYTQTIEIKNNLHDPKNFRPGVYILEAGLKVSGGPDTTGSGVLFYNEGGTFNLSGAKATFTGHEDYMGLILWQPVSNSAPIPVNGGSTRLVMDGGIYAPGSVEGYAISQGGPISRLKAVIATNMTLGGSGTVCVGDVTRPCPPVAP